MVDVAAEDPARYSKRPLPAYRFIPGQQPHPRRDPRGHSYGVPEPQPAPFAPEEWRVSDDYRYAVDLYNFGYWWECHEVLEGLWHAVGRTSDQGNFFQALIDVAAANLKAHSGASTSAVKLWRSGLQRLQRLPSLYMGIDVRALEAEMSLCLLNRSRPTVRLRLTL